MRWKWWAKSGPAGDTAADRLAAEPEAWLAGTYVDWLLSHHRLVPTWAWLNPVAHLDESSLRELAASRPVAANGWGLACYLSGELLAVAERDGTDVRTLQHECLVPLELELARRTSLPGGLRRSDLAPLVAAALGASTRS